MFEESWWAVQLQVPTGDERLMSSAEAFGALPVADMRMVQYAYADPDAEDSEALVTVELRARSRSDAVKYAQQMIGATRAAVGLPQDPLVVEWVAPQGNTQSGSRRFFEEARDLVTNEQFEMAVVAAQIHFESGLRTLMQEAVSRTDVEAARLLLSNANALNLLRETGKAAVLISLGVSVGTLPEFSAYVEHVRRRNAVVHFAAEVDEAGARASLDAVHNLWLRLIEAPNAP